MFLEFFQESQLNQNKECANIVREMLISYGTIYVENQTRIGWRNNVMWKVNVNLLRLVSYTQGVSGFIDIQGNKVRNRNIVFMYSTKVNMSYPVW